MKGVEIANPVGLSMTLRGNAARQHESIAFPFGKCEQALPNSRRLSPDLSGMPNLIGAFCRVLGYHLGTVRPTTRMVTVLRLFQPRGMSTLAQYCTVTYFVGWRKRDPRNCSTWQFNRPWAHRPCAYNSDSRGAAADIYQCLGVPVVRVCVVFYGCDFCLRCCCSPA
jgi:hypothetical protein